MMQESGVMTANDVVNHILASKSMRRKDTCTGMLPLVPFLLMDCVYTLYCHDVKNWPLKKGSKAYRYRKMWSENYDRFNKEFFCILKQEERDFAIDLMDSMEKEIENPMMYIRVAIMNRLDEDFDTQKFLASCMLANILSQIASIYWSAIYKTPSGQGEENIRIYGVSKGSLLLANEVSKSEYRVDLNEDEGVTKAVDSLIKGIIDWVKDK